MGTVIASAPLTAMALVVTPERVRATADLCRLDLREDEVVPFAAQLQRVVAHIAELDALDLATVPPTSAPGDGGCPLRDDAPAQGLDRDEVMAQAPRSEAGAFVVPRFVES